MPGAGQLLPSRVVPVSLGASQLLNCLHECARSFMSSLFLETSMLTVHPTCQYIGKKCSLQLSRCHLVSEPGCKDCKLLKHFAVYQSLYEHEAAVLRYSCVGTANETRSYACGIGLARTRFSNFALICLASSAWLAAAACKVWGYRNDPTAGLELDKPANMAGCSGCDMGNEGAYCGFGLHSGDV